METKLTEQQINEIEACANAATPGPWKVKTGDEDTDGRNFGVYEIDIVPRSNSGVLDEDAINEDFISSSRSDIPALVSDWRTLRSENDRLKKSIYSMEQDTACLPENVSVSEYVSQLRAEVERLTAERDVLKLERDTAIENAKSWCGEANMFKNAWARETNGIPRHPKTHLIDELVLVTRSIREQLTTLRSAADDLIAYADKNVLNFQREKVMDFINRMR